MDTLRRAAGRLRKCGRKFLGISLAIIFVCAGAWTFSAEPAVLTQADFGNMSIEELMRIPLTLSRTEESFSQTAAAAYIITGDDIRRSGATSIPEALRGAPGIEVARVDQHTWAITARGFNDSFANKLLVMIDGRTVYTPLFSGVFWDVQDTVLEDIDHIEIIRGPGSTLWGANAVNGVINIVTKTAAQTQGALLSGGGGVGERGFGTVRYGGRITDEAHYRVFVKYFDRDDTMTQPDLPDGNWEMLRGGFRADWTPGTRGKPDAFVANQVTVQGDIYEGKVDQYFFVPVFEPIAHEVRVRDLQRMDGGNVLARWTHRFSDEADLQFQTYYDRTHRDVVIFSEQRDTFDADFQNHFRLFRRNAVVWGLGYRLTSDQTGVTPAVSLQPASRTVNLFSGFLQDEITVVENRLRLTLGSKLEHNDYTGWEFQPGGRLLWTPATNHTAWASVTRAVRTPSRAEDDVRINAVALVGAPVTLRGNRAIESEKVIAYELGYRVQPMRQLSFDIALFYNEYEDLRTLEFVPPPPGFAAAQTARNKMDGETYGVELAANWQPLDWWHFRGSYTFLQIELHRRSSSNNRANENIEGQSPEHQFGVHSGIDLPWNIELDAGLRYVDALPALSVPSYFSFDARLAWRPFKNFEVAIVGRNLLDDRHPEFRPTTIRTLPTQVERTVYGKLTWFF
jgi:iron complex outermembrane recepter protein